MQVVQTQPCSNGACRSRSIHGARSSALHSTAQAVPAHLQEQLADEKKERGSLRIGCTTAVSAGQDGGIVGEDIEEWQWRESEEAT